MMNAKNSIDAIYKKGQSRLYDVATCACSAEPRRASLQIGGMKHGRTTVERVARARQSADFDAGSTGKLGRYCGGDRCQPVQGDRAGASARRADAAQAGRGRGARASDGEGASGWASGELGDADGWRDACGRAVSSGLEQAARGCAGRSILSVRRVASAAGCGAGAVGATVRGSGMWQQQGIDRRPCRVAQARRGGCDGEFAGAVPRARQPGQGRAAWGAGERRRAGGEGMRTRRAASRSASSVEHIAQAGHAAVHGRQGVGGFKGLLDVCSNRVGQTILRAVKNGGGVSPPVC
jgi:hypothetical protein